MKNLVRICVLLCAAVMANAVPVVITFDDLSANINDGYGMLYNEIPQNYQGLVWTPYNIVSGWNVNSGSTYKSVFKNTYDPVSLGNFASNSGAAIASVSGTTFNFDGAYFSTWADHDGFTSWSATSVTVEGYNGTTLVGSITMNLSSNGYTWLNAGFKNITKIDINGGNGKYWIMDNFTIPEPATIGILSLGALSLFRKKK